MNTRWYEDFFHGVALDLWRGAQRAHTVREVGDLLAPAGWTVESLSRSLQGDPFRPGDPCLIVVAGRASGRSR